jgi:[ribosomal protein S5]-alanine N-acetyltransferase
VSIEGARETGGATGFAATNIIVVVTVLPARVEWLEALLESDEVFAARFGIPVVAGWVGFPEALPAAGDGARRRSEDPWGTHLFFDDDGALVGFGGFKGEPNHGEVELGYAVAPARQRRGVATAVVEQLVNRAHTAGVNVVSAHTLAEENASTAVLRKCGFVRTGQAHQSGDDVWRWEWRSRRPKLLCQVKTGVRFRRRPVGRR